MDPLNFILKRNTYRPDGIFGELFIKGYPTSFCVTLEHAYKCENGYEPKIAAGTYECRRRQSPKFAREVFQVLDVPPFHGTPVTDIEIHIGNFNHDSIGCILLGRTIQESDAGEWAIDFSRATFDQFMDSLTGEETFRLTVL